MLGVTALGESLADATQKAYEAVAKINFTGMHYRFTGMHYRKDIADKALR